MLGLVKNSTQPANPSALRADMQGKMDACTPA